MGNPLCLWRSSQSWKYKLACVCFPSIYVRLAVVECFLGLFFSSLEHNRTVKRWKGCWEHISRYESWVSGILGKWHVMWVHRKNTFIPGPFSLSVHSPRPCPHVFLLYLFYRLVIFFFFQTFFPHFHFHSISVTCCSPPLRSDLPFLPFSSFTFSFHPSFPFLSAGSSLFSFFLSISWTFLLFSLSLCSHSTFCFKLVFLKMWETYLTAIKSLNLIRRTNLRR